MPNIENLEYQKFENKLVLQNYKVTMSRHELSAIEMRIMAMVILKLKDAQLNGYDEDIKDSSDLFDNFNRITIRNADLTIGTNYKQVKNALKSLTQRPIELKKDKGTYFFNLVREAYYSDDGTKITIDVSPNILPELIEIGKNYTQFGLEFLFKTKSSHAIRWYQIGSHWLKNHLFFISKDEIRELFKAQDKYKAHKDFERRLITDPLAELNSLSDINLEIRTIHKQGRSIVGYTMIVRSKKKNIETNENEEKLPQMLDRYILQQGASIMHWANKCNYDYRVIRNKLVERGIPEGVTNQTHFNNMTNKLVAKILSSDGQTNLTIEQILRELKS